MVPSPKHCAGQCGGAFSSPPVVPGALFLTPRLGLPRVWRYLLDTVESKLEGIMDIVDGSAAAPTEPSTSSTTSAADLEEKIAKAYKAGEVAAELKMLREYYAKTKAPFEV